MGWLRHVLGDRLRVEEGRQTCTIRWRRFTAVDVVASFALPVASAWGIASAAGLDAISDMKVIPMSPLATVVYWAVVALFTVHFVFNRRASLVVRPSEILYQLGRVPGRVRAVDRQGSVLVSIETREDPIAESDAAGRTPDRTTLSIRGRRGRIDIDDLSEDDARRVSALIERVVPPDVHPAAGALERGAPGR